MLLQCTEEERPVHENPHFFAGAHVLDQHKKMYIAPCCSYHNNEKAHSKRGFTMLIDERFLIELPGCKCHWEHRAENDEQICQEIFQEDDPQNIIR